MDSLNAQTRYWDGVAEKKTFTHPIELNLLRKILAPDSNILDVGCGYGRICADLRQGGYGNTIGVDISSAMIQRGWASDPTLDLRRMDAGPLPFADNSFAAATLFAVLTCIPTNGGQENMIAELARVLCAGGYLYISDYPLQQDDRNLARYRRFEAEFGQYGVFRLFDGGVLRHHDMAWIDTLLKPFEIINLSYLEVPSMHGNPSTIFQIIAKKKDAKPARK